MRQIEELDGFTISKDKTDGVTLFCVAEKSPERVYWEQTQKQAHKRIAARREEKAKGTLASPEKKVEG
jgi:hypothetical protein